MPRTSVVDVDRLALLLPRRSTAANLLGATHIAANVTGLVRQLPRIRMLDTQTLPPPDRATVLCLSVSSGSV